MPSEPLTVLAAGPVQRTFMVLGGAPVWLQLVGVVCGWLPIAIFSLLAGAALAARKHPLALPGAAFGVSLSVALLAAARIVARPLYIAAVAPGMLPPSVDVLITRAIGAAFHIMLAAGAVTVVLAALARRFIPPR